MDAPRKQPTASPRFPRGLELMLCLIGGLLLGFGLWQSRTEIETSGVVSVPHEPNIVQRPGERDELALKSDRPETLQDTFWINSIAKIWQEKNMEKREEIIASLVNAIAVADIQSALNDLQRLRQRVEQHDIADQISLHLIRRWAQYDPCSASAWAQQLPAGSTRQEALTGLAMEWANASLAEAATWARQLPEPTEKQMTLFAIANEAVRIDPVVALRLAMELPSDNQWKDLVQRSAQEWAATNGEQAVTWAQQIEDEPLRNQVLAGMAVAISESDPVSAATLVTTKLPEGRTRSDAVVGIVERWGQQQPEQAAAWVETFPKNDLKVVAVENLVAVWSVSDSEKAEQWRNQMLVVR